MSKPTQQGITFSKNDVEIIARETLYRGFFSLDLYRFRHRLFNGGMSEMCIRDRCIKFAQQHNMAVVTIEDLVAYRREHERKAS